MDESTEGQAQRRLDIAMQKADRTRRFTELAETYGEMITNTGGNAPMDLVNRLENDGQRLAHTNIIVYTMAMTVEAQLSLLDRLQAAGMLAGATPGA